MGPAGSKVLRYFYENKGRMINAAEIEEQLNIDFYTVKGLIDVLQSQGLLEDVAGGVAGKISRKGIEEFLLYY